MEVIENLIGSMEKGIEMLKDVQRRFNIDKIGDGTYGKTDFDGNQ
jgi:hypothetical protein